MSAYTHLLVAIDFSDESARVLDRAMDIAAVAATRLSLIHVVEYSPYLFPPDSPLPVDVDLESKFLAQANQRLKTLIDQRGLTQSEHYTEVGSPTIEIVRVAQEQGVDLIVLGSHGRHGLQRVMGSTASGVMHTANCDVLAVRIHKQP